MKRKTRAASLHWIRAVFSLPITSTLVSKRFDPPTLPGFVRRCVSGRFESLHFASNCVSPATFVTATHCRSRFSIHSLLHAS